nr:unnamed protein product [Digitaria exilis]
MSFSKLVSIGIVQAPITDMNYRIRMWMSMCQVNDFLREFIVSRSLEENLVFALEGHCKKNSQRSGRHLAIHKSWDRDKNVFESIDFSRLRSLTVFGEWESFFISENMGLLQVMDLEDESSGVTNGDVDKTVKLLPRLKFLSLRRCRVISHLPNSLGDLKHLQTLDIRETSVIKLPKSIIKLEKLQCFRAGTAVILDTDSSTGTFGSLPVAAVANPSTSAAPMSRPCATLVSCLSKLSIHNGPHNGVKVPRGIVKLSNLHTLGVVSIAAGTLELSNLTQLHKLVVSGINRKNREKFLSEISRLHHLESLSLIMQANRDNEEDSAGCTSVADIMSPLEKLRSLKLYGLVDRLPTWIMQMCLQLPRLEKLDLPMKKLPQQDLDFVLTLPYLRSLRLRLEEFQDGELHFGWSIAQSCGGYMIDFLEIAFNSRLQASEESVEMP